MVAERPSLGADLSLALDPVRLARRAGFAPDPWQAQLLRSQDRQQILLCCRQSGKSTTCAFRAVHEAAYRPQSLILCLAPALRQSQELFRKVRALYGELTPDMPALAEESALRLELVNGSRIICLPGKEQTIRGYSGVSLLLVDEASRVDDALYSALRPMLAVSGGRLVLLSTPFGRRGFFWQAWEEGEGWERVCITAYECPRISAEWLEAEKRALGEWAWEQEYLCKFVQTEDQVFAHQLVMNAVSSDVLPLFGGVG